jgi:hypothetical protein
MPGGFIFVWFPRKFILLSRVPKKSKVVVLSSIHHASSLDKETQKPQIIDLYNQTKGVNSLDKKCENYSASRRTRRWPKVTS